MLERGKRGTTGHLKLSGRFVGLKEGELREAKIK
jgi:hypothetical protein